MPRNKSFKTNHYIIPVNVINEMDKMIYDTHIDRKERGMSLCSNKKNNKIEIGLKSIGTDRGIAVPEQCRKKSQKYLGSYHTHPDDSETAASAQDLFSSCLKISNLDCIGKNEQGEIVCYEKQNKNSSCVHDVKPLLDIENIFHELPRDQLPEIKRNLYDEVDKTADKHFNFHIVKAN